MTTFFPLPSARSARALGAVVLPLPAPYYKCSSPICSILFSLFVLFHFILSRPAAEHNVSGKIFS